MNKETKGILLIGNFLSKEIKTRSLCEDFALKLEGEDFLVYKRSNKKNGLMKLADIIFSIFILRNKYFLSIIDLFSSKAFIWGFLSGIFLRFLRKDYVIILRGGELPEFSLKYKKFVKYLLKRAKKVIAPSEYLKKEMEVFRKDITVIPNPINIEKYNFYLRKKIGKRLIWIRAFHSVYNPMMAILTLEELLKSYNDLILCMIGPDKKDGSLFKIKNYIESKNIESNIQIIKGVSKEEIPYYLEKYDIFLNTSNIDNFPVSVLEAMACGLCIITTNVGGIPFFLKDQEDSIFVPKGDYKKMAEAVKFLLDNENFCQKISRNARLKAENFSWQRVLPLWKEIING